MPLSDHRAEADMCCRCSACKFIPLEMVTEPTMSYACPSVSRYGFHAYSAAGRLAVITSLLEGRIKDSDRLEDVVYNCNLCGACDISCKYAMDMEVLEPLYGLRQECVEMGRTVPAFDKAVESLVSERTLVTDRQCGRGEWCEGLEAKRLGEAASPVVLHVGCRTAFDRDLWPAARAMVSLLKKAEVDFAIGGSEEPCCGGRAHQMGYAQVFIEQARFTMDKYIETGATSLVTGCAECYHAFKVLYEQYGISKGALQVLHISEYLARLIEENRLKPTKPLTETVTYHDPCHLGRLGEPFIPWEGKPIPGHMRRFEPVKEFRRGTNGVYDPPREVLRSVPGLELVEMPRTKEYAWCCGSGGGVSESNPNFARWTAEKRIEEAEGTGADVIVTACPGCARILSEAATASMSQVRTRDLAEILDESAD